MSVKTLFIKFNRNLFFKYIIQFLSILIIPIIIFYLFFNNYFYSNTIKYNNEQQLDMAKNSITILSSVFSQLNSINLLISQNKDLAPPRIKKDFYNVSRAKDELRKTIYVNNIIKDCYIMIPDFDYAISKQSSHPLSVFKKSLNNELINKCNSFNDVIDLKNTNKFLSADFASEYTNINSRKDTICYFTSILNVDDFAQRLYVMYVLDSEVLSSLLSSVMYNPEYMNYCISYKNDVLVSSFSEIPPINFSQLKNDSLLEYDDNKYYISYLHDEDSSLDIAFFTEYNFYTEPLKDTFKQFLIMLTIILFLGTIIIVLLSIFNYRPIKHIKKLLRSTNSTDAKKANKIGDYDYIIKNLNVLIDKNTDMMENGALTRRHLKNYCIFKILNSPKIDIDTTKKVLNKLNINFNKNNYMCLFIKLNSVLNEEQIAQDIEVLKKSSVTQSHFESCYVINDTNVNVIINFYSEDNNSIKQKILGFCNIFCNQYNCYIGIGGFVYGLDNIHSSYKQATIAAQYAKTSKNDKFIFYDNIKALKNTNLIYNNNYFNTLNTFVRKQDKTGIINTLNEIKEYIVSNTIPIYMIKSTYYHIVNTILLTYSNKNLNNMNQLLINLDDLLENNSLDEVNKKIVDCCSLSFQNNKDSTIANEFIKYIQMNCLNYDFSIQNMASRFNISHQQMSNIFKSETQTTLMDYINNFRINKAVNLLVNTDIPVSSIVCKVGYIDSSSFTRKFKKMMGVTPAKYRKLYSEKTNK